MTSPRSQAVYESLDGSTVIRYPAVLDPSGTTWIITVPNFGEAKRVTLVLTNGSARFSCWHNRVYSCQGNPLDDNTTFFYTATGQLDRRSTVAAE